MNKPLKLYYPLILGIIILTLPLVINLFFNDLTRSLMTIVTTEQELKQAIETAGYSKISIYVEGIIDLNEVIVIDGIDVTIGGSGTLTAVNRNRHFIIGENVLGEETLNTGRLTLIDTIVLTQPEGYDGYSGGVWVNGGTFIMSGGSIVDNNWQIPQGYADHSRYRAGGGVHVRGLGLFRMYDGIIAGNQAVYGGGIYLDHPDGSVVIHGGIIQNNEAYLGGAFYHDGFYSITTSTGSGFSMSPAPSMTVFEMHGGEIISNQAKFVGGAMYFHGSSNAYLNGGIIRENVASSHGGIYGNLLHIGRRSKVTENTPTNEWEISELQLFLSWLVAPNGVVFALVGMLVLIGFWIEVNLPRP